MKLRKLAALGLAATMVMGSSVVTFAADTSNGSQTGAGKLEGTVDTEVFSVVLPTTDENTFKFTLDPEGLIKKTENAAYSGATFGEGTLFFQTDTNQYSDTSKELQVVNKSSVNVDVALKAEVTADGIELNADKTFEGDTSASMYLAIKSGEDEVAVTSDAAAEYAATVKKAPDNAYEYKYDSSKKTYSYELKADADSTVEFEKLTFAITGAANVNGDWSSLASATPGITVTWDVKKADNSVPSFTSDNLGIIDYTKGSGDNAIASITSVTATYNGRAYDALKGSSAYSAATVSANKITLDSRFVSFFSANPTTKMTISYVDGTGVAKTVVVDVKTAE